MSNLRFWTRHMIWYKMQIYIHIYVYNYIIDEQETLSNRFSNDIFNKLLSSFRCCLHTWLVHARWIKNTASRYPACGSAIKQHVKIYFIYFFHFSDVYTNVAVHYAQMYNQHRKSLSISGHFVCCGLSGDTNYQLSEFAICGWQRVSLTAAAGVTAGSVSHLQLLLELRLSACLT